LNQQQVLLFFDRQIKKIDFSFNFEDNYYSIFKSFLPKLLAFHGECKESIKLNDAIIHIVHFESLFDAVFTAAARVFNYIPYK